MAYKKITKAEARYRDYPKGMEWCSRCSMFIQSGECTAVQGEIYRRGWCKLYEPKPAQSVKEAA